MQESSNRLTHEEPQADQPELPQERPEGTPDDISAELLKDEQDELLAETLDEPLDENENPVRPKKKMKLGVKIALGVLALLLFSGAAYLGGQLLSGQGLGIGGSRSITFNDGKGGTTTMVQLDMDRAPELPKEKSIVSGIVDHIEDNSLFLGTGQMMAVDSGDGKVDFQYDGPVVEVVVNHDTKIYHDKTDLSLIQNGEKVKQVVEPGLIDDIEKNKMVNVWGEKQGDRVVAKVLLYH